MSEWTEALLAGGYRATRGGSWEGAWNLLQSTASSATYGAYEGRSLGFRVASPEPMTLGFLLVGGAVAFVRRSGRRVEPD